MRFGVSEVVCHAFHMTCTPEHDMWGRRSQVLVRSTTAGIVVLAGDGLDSEAQC